MIAYSVNKGREGLLINPAGEVKPFVAQKSHAFYSDTDIIMDPIRLHNNQLHGHGDERPAPGVSDALQKAANLLAKQGYTVFMKEGSNSREMWGFAIILTEDDSEMD